ncbi:MAG: lipopolysaccharide biosynthesis protein [Terracidiphilus sp.]
MLAGMGQAGALGMLAGDVLGIKSTDALFVAVARSRTVEDGIIAHFDLQRVYRAHYIDQARKRLETNTEIADDKKSGIVTITVTDHDPIRARDMAQAYVELLDQTLRTASTSSARREREFLEGRLAAVKGELADATARLSRFSSDTNTIDIKEQGKSTVDVVAMLQGQLMAAQTQLRGLQEIYTDDNLRIMTLKARIAELQSQVAQVSGSQGVGGIPSLRQLPNLGANYNDLYRAVKTQETVFETLTQQYELAKVEEAKQIPSVKYLDLPVVPERKSGPSRMLLALTFPVTAFIACCCFILARRRLSSMHDDERLLFVQQVWSDVRHIWQRSL